MEKRRMHGGYGANTGFLRDVCHSFVSMIVVFCGRERGTWVEANGSLSRSIEEWKEGPRKLHCVFIDIPVFTSS